MTPRTRRCFAHGFTLITLGTLGLALFGCDAPGFTTKKATSPANVAKTAEPVGEATTTGAMAPLGGMGGNAFTVETQGLAISDAIAKACGIAPRKTGSTGPNFEFDSAALADEDRELLQQVARCLSDGPLRGKNVSLVGRADARGEPEYNMTLGESRADAVTRYLVDLGVGRGRLTPTSRGELDATGSDEAGWAHDRRVDIELAK